ncbi:DUF4843 domain-containing protein [Chitinophaga horti]|uniref:DUF4843 domain-containing protein n=1 Tax=Chitinophaga horti TaxID=2920382 RepID=A0ABY6J3D4_9BACT|nr:DUF4843 domain-containing protein [Chitinophaga horti]UYQ94176.1 DUF4843 domain-containing protein [Chitinophaga horti]
MNRILLLLLMTITFFSCQKSSEITYKSETDAVNIWLGTSLSAKPDSMEYNFAFRPAVPTDSVVFTAMVLGNTTAQDRRFVLKAIGGDTNRVKQGVHYEFGDYTIRGNGYTDTFAIYIKRTNDFKVNGARIVFGVSETGDLKRGLIESSKVTIILKDIFAKPAHWDVDPYPYTKLSTYFGVYSNVKFQFITTVIGKAPIFRVLSAGTLKEGEVDFTTVTYYKNSCIKQLNVYNAANPGNPLRDENNNLITIP